jgi:hypothetical protein
VNERLLELQRITLRHEGRKSSEVLFDELPRKAQDELAAKQKHGPSAGAANSPRKELQSMRGDAHTGASQGSEPSQQRSNESRGAVFSLPPQGTLRTTSVVELRDLPNAVSGSESPQSQQGLQGCAVCGRVGAHLRTASLAPNRVGRLRAYGNAIVAPAAQAFVEAVMECRP